MQKHLVLLIVVPLLLACLVVFLTRRDYPKFVSQAKISCSSLPQSAAASGGGFVYPGLPAGPDNFVTLIRSRKTLQEAAIRLLSQHLLLGRSDPRFISAESYSRLISITPSYIYKYVAARDSDRSQASGTVDKIAYEQTVRNLTELARSSDTNFVYRLLNEDNPHYSIEALSRIRVRRVGKTGIVKLAYESDDPGICQQTLAILTAVCMDNQRHMMESGSRPNSSVISQNNDLISEYRNKELMVAGLESYRRTLEDKLSANLKSGLKSEQIQETIGRLEAISLKFASTDLLSQRGTSNVQKLAYLNFQAGNIKDELRAKVISQSNAETSADRSAFIAILSSWTDNLIETVNLQASLKVLEEKLTGAGIDIQDAKSSIAESRSEGGVFSSSGLAYVPTAEESNILTVRVVDNEPVSAFKTIDPPGYPLSPSSSKRYVMILGSALLGFMVVFSGAWSAGHYNDSIGGPGKAAGILQADFAGILPRITDGQLTGYLKFVMKRLLDVIILNIDINIKNNNPEKPEKIVIFFSMQRGEGKTFAIGNLSKKLIRQGKNILYLNFSAESLTKNEILQSGYDGLHMPEYLSGAGQSGIRFSFAKRILGYNDRKIDHGSELFINPNRYLESTEYLEYKIDKAFFDSKSYWDILIQNSFGLTFIPDYVFIELPPILYFQYPPGLFAEADLPMLICRSDRKWTEADQSALNTVARLTNRKIHFILNQADDQAIKSVLGELS